VDRILSKKSISDADINEAKKDKVIGGAARRQPLIDMITPKPERRLSRKSFPLNMNELRIIRGKPTGCET
jgi:hypothetical protein